MPDDDRPVWMTLVWTGVRRGELRGLRCSDLDFDASVLHIEQQHQPSEGFKPTKGRRNRNVPMNPPLARSLRAHLLRTGRRDGLVFGAGGARPLDTRKLQARADLAWEAVGLARVTPHVCRHLYATAMAASRVQIERLSRYMGHSSIQVTWDNYGHLFPGDEVADGLLLEAFFGRDEAGTAPRAVPREADPPC